MASVMPRAAIGLQILLLLCAKQATGDCTLGKATFYYPADQPGRGTGSCGTSISDTDLVGALGYAEFGGGPNPNEAPICGTEYTVIAPNGNSVKVQIQDKCEACDNDAPHIDLTPAAFKALGYPLEKGVIRPVGFGTSCQASATSAGPGSSFLDSCSGCEEPPGFVKCVECTGIDGFPVKHPSIALTNNCAVHNDNGALAQRCD